MILIVSGWALLILALILAASATARCQCATCNEGVDQ